ncbi:MAG: prolipoprotein diacylglyceryl transferase [Undibacterium sp.]|nr:prolipoprotein diacylglyceryl transferase [Undibacterium sp.]
MLQHPNFDPVAFTVFGWPIHWYGIMYLIAFAQFILLGRYRLGKQHVAALGWTKEHIEDMLFYGVLGVVLGGRLGEILFYQQQLLLDPIQILMVWKGGMSFHGGFIGVLIAMFLWSRKAKMPLVYVYDFIAPLVPLGYAAGRFGNFINHELPGRVAAADLPWAMQWPGLTYPVHPSPLYQLLVDGILVFCILWWFARKSRPTLAVGALYVMLYGCARTFTEFFRTPDYEVNFLGLTISAGQMLSIPMIVAGAILLWLAYQNKFAVTARIPSTPSTPNSTAQLKRKKNHG